MAILKNTVQVNNGNAGWNQTHVMDALEEVFGDLNWNSGTTVTGRPTCTKAPDSGRAGIGIGWYVGYEQSWNQAAPAIPYRQSKNVYYDVFNDGTNGYRVLKKWYFTTSNVDETTDTFTSTEHQLSTGDPIVWGPYGTEASEDNIPELTYGTTYYAIVLTDDTFKIAASAVDAAAETAIDISAKGSNVSIAFRQEYSSIANNNTVNVLKGDAIYFYDYTTDGTGAQFTLCSNVDDYNASNLLTSSGYGSVSNIAFPRDFSNTELEVPNLSGGNGLIFLTYGFRQTESESFMPVGERHPDWDAASYYENSLQKYIYCSDTNTGMVGEIVIHPSVTGENAGSDNRTDRYPYWKYTVPADGDRSALNLRVYRDMYSTGRGDVVNISLTSLGNGWNAGETFTIPGDQIGGETPTHDITFGVRSYETSSGADDGVGEISVCDFGSGPSLYQKNNSGHFGVLRLENDASKTYGVTYWGIGLESGNEPYRLNLTSGPHFTTINTRGSNNTETTSNTSMGYFDGRPGLDYQEFINYIFNNSYSYQTTINFATSGTPTAYPLKFVVYQAQAPQDSNFAIIQCVQTINGVDQQYDTFYLHKGNQIGANIYDLDYVWQGCIGKWGSYDRSLNHYTNVPGYRTGSTSTDEPPSNYSLGREAFYGYYRDSNDNYTGWFQDDYDCNIDTNNSHTSDAVTYFRDATYDQYNGYSVSSSADYYRPVKGIPLSRKMMPVPYTLPDDFALLQVSTSPGLTNFRPGDTITISPSEVYEVVRAAWVTNQNSLDNVNEGSSMGMLLLARTT